MAVNSSRVDTNQIDSAFLEDVLALLTALPASLGTFYITCGWRDGAVEAAGYAAWKADHTKPKYTDPDDSAHVGTNFPDDCSRAIDVTLSRGGKDIWEAPANEQRPVDPGWAALIAAVQAHPRLHSLVSIGDYDHVEKLHWQQDKTPTQVTS